MKHLKVRCPACQKLYEVDPVHIKSLSPHFECVACHSLFSFDFPPTNPADIPTRRVQLEKSRIERSVPPGTLMANTGKNCNQCGSLNLVGSEVCYSCQAPFEFNESKISNVDNKTPESSLLNLWGRIFTDYENEELHLDFIKQAEKTDSLEFALKKYKELKEAQGGDPLCHKMLLQIELIRKSFEVQKQKGPAQREMPMTWKDFWVWLRKHNWQRILLWMPAIISLFIIVLGISNLGTRNLVGIGFAVCILSYGILIMIRGRPLQVSDFIE